MKVTNTKTKIVAMGGFCFRCYKHPKIGQLIFFAQNLIVQKQNFASETV